MAAWESTVIIPCKCYVLLVSRLNGGEEEDKKMRIKI